MSEVSHVHRYSSYLLTLQKMPHYRSRVPGRNGTEKLQVSKAIKMYSKYTPFPKAAVQNTSDVHIDEIIADDLACYGRTDWEFITDEDLHDGIPFVNSPI